MFPYTKYANIH